MTREQLERAETAALAGVARRERAFRQAFAAGKPVATIERAALALTLARRVVLELRVARSFYGHPFFCDQAVSEAERLVIPCECDDGVVPAPGGRGTVVCPGCGGEGGQIP
jgi:hypothetical protein